MRALIDADLLRYQVGFASEFKDDDGNTIYLPFEKVAEKLDDMISEICEEVWADVPTLYLTPERWWVEKLGHEWKPNFRIDLAVSHKYKERAGTKPFHYKNLTWYMLDKYDVVFKCGLEADDLLAIDHLKEPDTTIICSRDKDLKMVPGKHFGWSCGKQQATGIETISEIGEIDPKRATGLKQFYKQLLTGDSVDTIPGLRGYGPVAAYKLLADAQTEEELYRIVSEEYKKEIGEGWKTYLQEQANLLWMVRELTDEGEPVLYVPYEDR